MNQESEIWEVLCGKLWNSVEWNKASEMREVRVKLFIINRESES